MNSLKYAPTRLFFITGLSAIIAGGVLSAFAAKQPSTVTMWSSAYLVLVVGITQGLIGEAIASLNHKTSQRLIYLIFSLLNVGSGVVIAGTVLKYAGLGWNITLTVTGSIMLVIAFCAFGWIIRQAKSSPLKTIAYAITIVMLLSIPLGIVLAHQ